jgi:hypothetical protein
MNAIPFCADAQLVALVAPLFIIAALLLASLVLRRVVDWLLDEDNPRRQYITGTAGRSSSWVVWLRHRP